MRTSAKTLYDLLENLLTWSRLQRGIIECHPESFPLTQIVQHSLSLFQAAAEQKQIMVHNLIQADLLVYADFKMIDTIMRNLVSNALKFTDSGGSIEIFANEHEDAVEIAVADTGIGMSAEVRSKLFRLDLKYSRPGTDGEKGTGLGLILCKDLIERNNGNIRVESIVGQGSTFLFTLPKQAAPEEEAMRSHDKNHI